MSNNRVILKTIYNNENELIKFILLVQRMIRKDFKQQLNTLNISSMEAKQIIENIIFNPKNKNKSLEYIKQLIKLKFIEFFNL
jgi:hypothetical protein